MSNATVHSEVSNSGLGVKIHVQNPVPSLARQTWAKLITLSVSSSMNR